MCIGSNNPVAVASAMPGAVGNQTTVGGGMSRSLLTNPGGGDRRPAASSLLTGSAPGTAGSGKATIPGGGSKSALRRTVEL